MLCILISMSINSSSNQHTSDEKRIQNMRVASKVIKLVDGRKKYTTDRPFRHTESILFRLKENSQCAICNEKRALEFCHIIPVAFLKLIPKEFSDLGKGTDNGVILCKTHHWCFDHQDLTNEELEKIYQTSKVFINNVLKIFINSEYTINPDTQASTREKTIIKNYVLWMKWTARIFFIKN